MMWLIRRYPLALVAFVIGIVLVVMAAMYASGAGHRRHDFVKRCLEGDGQLVTTKAVMYCVYPDGRMEQG